MLGQYFVGWQLGSCPCWPRPLGKHTEKNPTVSVASGKPGFYSTLVPFSLLCHCYFRASSVLLEPFLRTAGPGEMQRGDGLGHGIKNWARLLPICYSTSPLGGCLSKAHAALSQRNTPLEDGHYQKQQEAHMCTLLLPLSQRWS